MPSPKWYCRRPASEHLVEDRAASVDVRSRANDLISRNLRGHVGRGRSRPPGELVRSGAEHRAVDPSHHPGLFPGCVKMNVARTHPSVDESEIVSRLKCSSNLRDTIGDVVTSEILRITQEGSKRGRE